MAYCTSADLAASLGGAAVMVQLLDKDGDGVADSAAVAACIGRATSEAASRIQVVLDLTALDSLAAYPDALIYHTADIAAYHAWLQGGEGQTMPEAIQKKRDDAIDWMESVAKRRATLGVVPKSTQGQLVEQIDRNPSDVSVKTPTNRSMVGGFW